jgi:hypothetical protein
MAATMRQDQVSGGRQDQGEVVPEAGQGEQIQRIKVSDLGSTLKR